MSVFYGKLPEVVELNFVKTQYSTIHKNNYSTNIIIGIL
jgi:hypothetical protein